MTPMLEKMVAEASTKQEKRPLRTFHPLLASGRWFTLTFSEQVGNIGSEVRRAISWKGKNMPEQSKLALARALELFDLTLADDRWAGPRRREVARAREVVCDFVAGDNQYKSKSPELQKYFDAFALAARQAHLPSRTSHSFKEPLVIEFPST